MTVAARLRNHSRRRRPPDVADPAPIGREPLSCTFVVTVPDQPAMRSSRRTPRHTVLTARIDKVHELLLKRLPKAS